MRIDDRLMAERNLALYVMNMDLDDPTFRKLVARIHETAADAMKVRREHWRRRGWWLHPLRALREWRAVQARIAAMNIALPGLTKPRLPPVRAYESGYTRRQRELVA